MKTNETSTQVRPSIRILTVTAVLALGVGSLLAGGSPAPFAPKAPARPLRPVCNIPNCVEVKWPANGKTSPTFIRCEVGKPCHPHCSRHCS